MRSPSYHPVLIPCCLGCEKIRKRNHSFKYFPRGVTCHKCNGSEIFHSSIWISGCSCLCWFLPSSRLASNQERVTGQENRLTGFCTELPRSLQGRLLVSRRPQVFLKKKAAQLFIGFAQVVARLHGFLVRMV